MKQRKAFDGRTKGLIIMLHNKGWTYDRLAKKFFCYKGTIKRYCKVY